MNAPVRERPSVMQGIAVAAILALAGGAVFAGLGAVYPARTALQAVIAITSGAYVMNLIVRSALAGGRIVAMVSWLAAAALAAVFVQSIGALLVIHLVLVWLMRSICYHTHLTTTLCDLGIGALGIGAAVWVAQSTGSVALAIWCALLVQALFVLVPTFDRDAPTLRAPDSTDFKRAHASAETALRRLISAH